MSLGFVILVGPNGWGREESSQAARGSGQAFPPVPPLHRPDPQAVSWRSELPRIHKFLTTSPQKPLGELAYLLNSVPDRRYPNRKLEPWIYHIGLALCGYYTMRREENPDFARRERNQVRRLAQFFHYAVDALRFREAYREALMQRLPEETLFQVLGFNRPLFASSFFLLFGDLQERCEDQGRSVYQALKALQAQGMLEDKEVQLFLVRCCSFLQVHHIASCPEERRQLLADLLRGADRRTSVLLGLGIERMVAQMAPEERDALRSLFEEGTQWERYPQIVAESALRYFYEPDLSLDQLSQLPARLQSKDFLSSLWVFDPDGADSSLAARYLTETGWKGKILEIVLQNGSRRKKEKVRGFRKEGGNKGIEITLVSPHQMAYMDLSPYDVICLRGHSFQTSAMINKLKGLQDQLVINGGCGGYHAFGELLKNHPQAYYIGSGILTSYQGNNFYMAHLLEALACSLMTTWREVKEELLETCAGDPVMERIVENFVVPGTLPMLIYEQQWTRTKHRPLFLPL